MVGVRPRHVYVHVPFCARRCSYCDFSIAVRREVPVARYITGVADELQMRFPTEAASWDADTIYLGGGTPSLLGPGGIERLLAVLRSRIAFAADAEVTLEANPDDITETAAAAWRKAGINRLSIGAQSFDDGALRWMHRTHTTERIRTAVDGARSGGIESVSIDLIFALPAVLGRDWPRDLDSALGLGPDHISVYGLTVEPRTALGRWVARRDVAEAPEELYEAEFLDAHRVLTAAGYEHYEVSNYARPGQRARHNGAYWTGEPYIGLGPSAHGFDGRERRWNEPNYTAWLDRVAAGRDPVAGCETLTAANRTAERVYLELRTTRGTVLNEGETESARAWVQAGWARLEGSLLVLSPPGWLRLDTLAVALVNARSGV